MTYQYVQVLEKDQDNMIRPLNLNPINQYPVYIVTLDKTQRLLLENPPLFLKKVKQKESKLAAGVEDMPHI